MMAASETSIKPAFVDSTPGASTSSDTAAKPAFAGSYFDGMSDVEMKEATRQKPLFRNEVDKDTGLAVAPPRSNLSSTLSPGAYVPGGTFVKSVSRGIEQTQGLYGQFIREIGDTTGLASLVEVGDELVQEAFVEAVTNPPEITSLDDLRFSNAGTFVLQMLGEQALNIGLAGAAALVSGGTTVGLSGALMRAGVGKQAAEALAKRAAMKRAAGGTFGAFLPINTGEIIQEQRDAGLDPDLLSSTLLGAASSALEVAGFAGTLAPLFRGASTEVAGGAIKTILRRLGHASLAGVASEGGTEAVQETLVIASRALKDPTFSINDAIASSEGLKRIAFAGVAGATVGGVLGGAGGGVRGLQNAAVNRIKTSRLNETADRIKGGIEQLAKTDENNAEENLSFFDAAAAKKYAKDKMATIGKRVSDWTTRANKWLEAGVEEGTLQAHLSSIHEAIKARVSELQADVRASETAKGLLDQTVKGVNELTAQFRQLLKDIPAVTEQKKGTGEGTAVRKAGDEIRALLDKVNELKPSEQVKKLPEMIEMARKHVARGLNNPGTVNRKELAKLINKINTATRNAETQVKKAFRELDNVLAVNLQRLENLRKRLPEVTVTAEEALSETGKRMKTSLQELRAGWAQFKKGAKKYVTAVGWRLEEIPEDIRRYAGKNNIPVSMDHDTGEVIIGDREAAKTGNTVDVRDIPQGEDVTVTTRDEKGQTVKNEAAPKAVAPKVVAKEQAPSQTVEVRPTHEAVYESSKERIDEVVEGSVALALKYGAKGLESISGLYQALTGYVRGVKGPKNFAVNTAAKIKEIPDDTVIFPNGMTWGQFKEVYEDAEHLASLFVALESKYINPDLWEENINQRTKDEVQDLEDFIQSAQEQSIDLNEMFQLFTAAEKREENFAYYVRAGNGQLVLADIRVDADGNQVVQRADGKEIPKTTEKAVSKAKDSSTNRAKFPEGTEVQVQMIGDVPVVLAYFPEELGNYRINRQIMKAIERGNKARGTYNDRYVTEAKHTVTLKNGKKKTTTVTFHLGEITALGRLVNRNVGSATKFGQLTRAHDNFIEGMSYLEGELGYQFNEKQLENKVIYGKNVTFRKSKKAQPLFKRLIEIFETATEGRRDAVIQELETYFNVKDPENLSWNDISDWLVEEANKGKIDPNDMGEVIFGQGQFSRDYLNEWALAREQALSEPQSVLEGLRFVHSRVTRDVSTGKPTMKLTTRTEGIQRDLFQPTPGEVIEEVETEPGRTSTIERRESAADQFKPVDEFQLKTERDPQDVIDTDWANRSHIIQTQPGKKATSPVRNLLSRNDEKGTAWEAAGKATERVLKMLGIKERVVLFDEDSQAPLKALYESWARYYREQGDEATAEIYDEYVKTVDNIGTTTTGRITPPYINKKLIAKEHRLTHIFVSKVRTDKHNTTRSLKLGHELGHLTQYVHFFRLPKNLQRRVMKDVGTSHDSMDLKGDVKIEAFATWMAKYAADIANEQDRFDREGPRVKKGFEKFQKKKEKEYKIPLTPEEKELSNFFKAIVRDLKRVWEILKDELKPYYPPSFKQFVDALMTHQQVQDGTIKADSPLVRARLKTPLARAIFDELNKVGDNYGYLPETLGSRPSFNVNSEGTTLKQAIAFLRKGRQRYRNLQANRKRRQQERQARLIPENKWWVNAPSGKKLDLTDPKIKQILEEHNHWTLANDPELIGWRARSKAIAEHLVHSKLITRTEFLQAALKAKRDAESRYMSGELTLGELRETDLRNMLIEIINERVVGGDYYTLVESITAKLPSELDYANSDPEFLALAGDIKETKISAETRAKLRWSRKDKPSVNDIFSEAEGEVYSGMAEAHAEGTADDINTIEALVSEVGYLAEKYGVEITEKQLSAFLRNNNLAPQEYFDFNPATNAQSAQSSVLGNYVEDLQRMGKRLAANPLDAVKTLLWTVDAELRSMDSDTAKWIAQQFHVRPGENVSPLTVVREIYQRGAPWHKKLNDILTSVPGAKLTLPELAALSARRIARRAPSTTQNARQRMREEILVALQKHVPEAQLSADIHDHVMAIRKYLNELYDWYTNTMGLTLGEQKDYYPLMLDAETISSRREEFLQLLIQHGNFTQVEAEESYYRILKDSNGGLNNGYQAQISSDFDFLGPGFSAKKHRAKPTFIPSRQKTQGSWTPQLREALIDARFYQQDIATTLIAYTEMIVRRAVWETRFRETRVDNNTMALYASYNLNPKSPIAALQLKITQARDRNEINDEQYERIVKDLLPAYAGQLGLRVHPRIRKLNSTLVIYQNLRLLSFALFSSIVDLPTLLARPGFDMQAWSDSFQAMLNGRTREEARQMLLELGAMRINLTEHVLNDQALNTFTTGTAKRINDLFFRYNMMEGWTNLIRASAAYSGRSFIQRNAALAAQGDATAIKMLKELGIDGQLLSEAVAWDGYIGSASLELRGALNRYIDEAMIRPEAAIRPAWMSDPAYSVFSHLKGFLYGFHETFLRRVGNNLVSNAKNGDITMLVHQNLLPMLMLAMLTLPFAALGYELRRHVSTFGLGPPNKRPQGFPNYLQEVVERSGMPGVFQVVLDMEQAEEYGKPWGLVLGGPTVEHVYDFITSDDMGRIISRSVPVVAQSPTLSRWVRDTI